MQLKELVDLYCWIRENNHSIPDEVIDYMYEAAKEKYLKETKCSNCIGNGNQSILNTQCTGCGVDDEYLNFKKK